jgi:hypothetical protein
MTMPHIYLHGESPWKLGLGLLFLLFFFGMGIAHIIYPDYFLERSAIRKSGEMLTEWNRIGIQIVGLLVALFSAGIMYDIGSDLFRN